MLSLQRLTNPNRRPIFVKLRSAEWFIVLTVCVAVFTDVFLYSVIVPVIPFSIESRAGVASDDVQHWVSVLLAVYGGALLVAAPVFGVLADRIKSRQIPLLGGLLVLMGSTVMFCLGRSIALLVTARVLQGASAGVVWTVALALLSDTVGKDHSGQSLGYVAASYSIGTLIAPLLGGVVYRQGGYYEVFAMTFALIGLDIILRLAIIEKYRAARWLDGENSPIAIELHGTDSVTARQSSSVNARAESPVSVRTPSEKRKLPVMLTLMKSRRLQAAFIGSFVAAATMTAFDATLPIYCNRVFGWDSLGAGLIFIALLLPHMAGPVIGRFVDKFGPRWIATAGLILLMPFWVMLRLVDHDTTRQIIILVVLLVGVGASTALVVTSLMTEFSKVCDGKERRDPALFGGRSAYATSYGIFNISWALGALLGPIMAANIESSAGWKTMTWSFGVLSVVCAIPVVLFSGGLITRRKATTDGTI